jgi:hypothetical protein
MVLTIKRQKEKPTFAKVTVDAVVLAGRSSNFLKEDLLSIVGFDRFFKIDPEL